MKTSELEDLALEHGWLIDEDEERLIIRIDGYREIAYISKRSIKDYWLTMLGPELANKIAEYASTPPEDRVDKLYNVVVSPVGYSNTVVAYGRNDDAKDRPFFFATVGPDNLQSDDKLQFTEKQFTELIKHMKTKPNGDTLAKIVELGKVEVEHEDD